MRNNVQQLAKLTSNLEAAREELETINNEEALLQWEPTAFPQLQHMFQAKDPYDKLWNTLLNFTEKQEKWMKGWCGYVQIQSAVVHAVSSAANRPRVQMDTLKCVWTPRSMPGRPMDTLYFDQND